MTRFCDLRVGDTILEVYYINYQGWKKPTWKCCEYTITHIDRTESRLMFSLENQTSHRECILSLMENEFKMTNIGVSRLDRYISDKKAGMKLYYNNLKSLGRQQNGK